MAKTEPKSRRSARRPARANPEAEPATIELPVGQPAYDIEELRQRVVERLARRACPACGHGPAR